MSTGKVWAVCLTIIVIVAAFTSMVYGLASCAWRYYENIAVAAAKAGLEQGSVRGQQGVFWVRPVSEPATGVPLELEPTP